MTDVVEVVVSTQLIEVGPGTQRLIFDPQTDTVTVANPVPSVAVVLAGPPGPPGSLGSFDLVPVLEEVDSRIATHNQATPVHPGATSGRDFVALFQNGLV
jgi:hypothetical protein